MNRSLGFASLFTRAFNRACFPLFFVFALATASSAQQFTIGAYHLQSSVRSSLTTYDYTYTADLTNNGGAAQNVSGTVVSSSPNTIVMKSTVKFGTVPANSTVTSTDTFVIRQNRLYDFLLSSLSWTFTLTQPPTANAGPNQTAAVGSTVTLNGTGSTDPNSLPLTYLWTPVSIPSASSTTITNPTSAMPTLKIDVAGNYIIKLVVNDGILSSSAATVTISTTHTAPTANAGANQTGAVGSQIQLDGSASIDPDGNPLTYTWSIQSAPGGSTTVLSSTSAVKPTITLDKFGSYSIQLVVNDQYLSSSPSTVTINTIHTPPVANAGLGQGVTVGSTVTLSGALSSDVDGFPLTYAWSFTTLPSTSKATLTGATTVSPTFVLDVVGTYVVQLIVNDGYNSSVPVTVTISTDLLPPVANAGLGQTVPFNQLVQLSGAASSDPNNLPLTYSWTLLTKPGEARPPCQIRRLRLPHSLRINRALT